MESASNSYKNSNARHLYHLQLGSSFVCLFVLVFILPLSSEIGHSKAYIACLFKKKKPSGFMKPCSCSALKEFKSDSMATAQLPSCEENDVLMGWNLILMAWKWRHYLEILVLSITLRVPNQRLKTPKYYPACLPKYMREGTNSASNDISINDEEKGF